MRRQNSNNTITGSNEYNSSRKSKNQDLSLSIISNEEKKATVSKTKPPIIKSS